MLVSSYINSVPEVKTVCTINNNNNKNNSNKNNTGYLQGAQHQQS